MQNNSINNDTSASNLNNGWLDFLLPELEEASLEGNFISNVVSNMQYFWNGHELLNSSDLVIVRKTNG